MQSMHSRRGFVALAVVAGILAATGAAGTTSVALAAPPCEASIMRTGVAHTGTQALSHAIADALAGDTIAISGTCYGNVTITKDLTLQGQGNHATLDGQRQGRVIRIAGGTTTLRDLTVTNGRTNSLGGGIYVATAAVLVDVVVTGNTAGATQFGGGIEADFGSTLTLIRSEVSGNTAGGSGGIDMFRATATLIESTVTGNRATRSPSANPDGCNFDDTYYACAGGIWNYQGTLVLVDSTVAGNRAAHRGGGIVSYARFDGDGNLAAGRTILSGTTSVRGNAAADRGGGIYTSHVLSLVAADGTAAYTDPRTGATLPAWTGAISANKPDQCSPTLTLGGTTCGASTPRPSPRRR